MKPTQLMPVVIAADVPVGTGQERDGTHATNLWAVAGEARSWSQRRRYARGGHSLQPWDERPMDKLGRLFQYTSIVMVVGSGEAKDGTCCGGGANGGGIGHATGAGGYRGTRIGARRYPCEAEAPAMGVGGIGDDDLRCKPNETGGRVVMVGGPAG